MKLREGFDLLATAPGGIARLRELILSLAVQGKLVPQDPNDEPASELVKQIRAEKDRLRAEGKIKKDKPLPAISEPEKLFELPQRWEWVRIGNFAEIKGGKRLPAGHDFAPEPTPYIYLRVTNMKAGSIITDDVKYISESTRNEIINYTISQSDLYITIAGTIGAIGEIPDEFDGMNLTENAAKIVFSSVSKKWLKKVLQSNFCQTQFTEKTNQLAQPKLALHRISSAVLPLPPLAEQSRIVAKVDELMRLCDELETRGRLEVEQHARLTTTLFEALAASESSHVLAENWSRVAANFDLLLDRPEAVDALEQTILRLAVTGMLVPQDSKEESASTLIQAIRAQKECLIIEGKIMREKSSASPDDEEPYELPVGWQWCLLDQIAAVGTGTTPSRDRPDYFSPPTVNWVTSGETGAPFIASTAQHVSDLALRETSLTVYPVHTLIVAMYGQGKTRGQISELLEPAATNQACAAIVLVNGEAHHRKYVKLFFEKIYDEIRELAAGGAQPNLNVGKVKATLIPLPPLAEQERIVTRVEELRRLCADLRARLTDRQSCQTRLAEALVAQTATAGPEEDRLELAA